MRLFGWDVKTAYEAGLSGKVEDVQLLIYASGNDRILLTFDSLKAEAGQQIARELRTGGGKIIQIHGGAEQEKYRIVGKILFHYKDWVQFLSINDGISIISDIRHNCRNLTPEEYHQRYHAIDAEQFTAYLEKKKERLIQPLKRKRKAKPKPKEQPPLN